MSGCRLPIFSDKQNSLFSIKKEADLINGESKSSELAGDIPEYPVNNGFRSFRFRQGSCSGHKRSIISHGRRKKTTVSKNEKVSNSRGRLEDRGSSSSGKSSAATGVECGVSCFIVLFLTWFS